MSATDRSAPLSHSSTKLHHIWTRWRLWLLAALGGVVLLVLLLSTPKQVDGVCLAQSALWDEACTFCQAATQTSALTIDVQALVPSEQLREATQLAICIAADEADGVICDEAFLQTLLQEGFLQTNTPGQTVYRLERADSCTYYLCILPRADEAVAELLHSHAQTLQNQVTKEQ